MLKIPSLSSLESNRLKVLKCAVSHLDRALKKYFGNVEILPSAFFYATNLIKLYF